MNFGASVKKLNVRIKQVDRERFPKKIEYQVYVENEYEDTMGAHVYYINDTWLDIVNQMIQDKNIALLYVKHKNEFIQRIAKNCIIDNINLDMIPGIWKALQ
jgi:hypothetical protein